MSDTIKPLTSIAEGWESFLGAVVPAGCSDEQLKALQMAFYGGASAVFMAMMARALGPESADTYAAFARALHEEINRFAAQQRDAEMRPS